MQKQEESLVKEEQQYLLSYLTEWLGQAHRLAKLSESEGSFDPADLRRISLSILKAQTALEELRTSAIIRGNGMDVVS